MFETDTDTFSENIFVEAHFSTVRTGAMSTLLVQCLSLSLRFLASWGFLTWAVRHSCHCSAFNHLDFANQTIFGQLHWPLFGLNCLGGKCAVVEVFHKPHCRNHNAMDVHFKSIVNSQLQHVRVAWHPIPIKFDLTSWQPQYSLLYREHRLTPGQLVLQAVTTLLHFSTRLWAVCLTDSLLVRSTTHWSWQSSVMKWYVLVM